MKRSTIAKGGQPHDAVIPQTPAPQANVDKPQAGKSRITFILADEVQERLRDAVYWERESLSSLVERAITKEIDHLEKKQGERFVKRPTDLRRGRPAR